MSHDLNGTPGRRADGGVSESGRDIAKHLGGAVRERRRDMTHHASPGVGSG